MKKKILSKVISQSFISILIIVIMVLFAIWNYKKASNELIKNYSSYTLAVSQNNADTIEREFKDLALLFEYIANAVKKEGINDEVLSSPYFKKVFSSIAEEFLIFDSSGNTLLYTSGENPFLEPASLKSAFLATISEEKGLPTPRLSEYKTITIRDKKFGVFFFFKKIFYEPLNKQIYLTFVISGERILETYIKPLHLANEGYAFIIDDDEITIASGVREHIGKNFDEIEGEELDEMLKAGKYETEKERKKIRALHAQHKKEKLEVFTTMISGDSGTMRYTSRFGAKKYELLSFYPIDIPGDSWSFAVKTPYTYITDTFEAGFKRTTILTAIFILILFLDLVYIIYNYKKRLTAELEVDQVSDRLEKEQRLRRAKYRYKQLYQGTKDIILICSSDLMIEETNSAGVEAIGSNIKDIAHKMKFSDIFINSDDLGKFESILNKSGNVVNFQSEVARDGAVRHYEISADKQEDEREQKEFVYFVIRDVTEHKRLQEELINKEKLESAMALVVTANHEINNPLAGIILNIELINNVLTQKEDAAIKQIIDDISKNVFRISDVLKRLSEIESIKTKEYTKAVDMLDLDESGS